MTKKNTPPNPDMESLSNTDPKADDAMMNNPFAFPLDTNTSSLIRRLEYYFHVMPDAILTHEEIIILAKIVHNQLMAWQKMPINMRYEFADKELQERWRKQRPAPTDD